MVTITVNGLTSVFATSDPKIKEAFCTKYTKNVPGSYYAKQNSKYKGWNGKKEFISSKTGKFKTGLLAYIEKDLKTAEIPYVIQDNRTLSDFPILTIPGIELRNYQLEMYEKIAEKRQCIIKLPTASGKTAIIASVINSFRGEYGVVLFNRKSLLIQTYEYLTKLGFDVGICFGEGYINKPLMLCTTQSIEKILHTHLYSSKFIIFDEVHEFCKGKLTQAILEGFPNAFVRVGFSATIPTEIYHRLILVSNLGEIIDDYSSKDLADKGHLTPAKIQVIKLKDSSIIEDIKLSYLEIYDKYIVNNKERNKLIQTIVNTIKDKNKNCKILLLVQSLKHLEILKKEIPDAITLQGNDSILKRNEAIKKFQKSKSAVMIGTVILQTGINIPEITHFINCRGLKSEIPTIQAMGRALRQHKSKNIVYIYDIFNQEGILHSHSKKRLRTYKKMKFEVKLYENS